MKQKKLKQLVEVSYTRGKLDAQKIEKIALVLSRKDLKQYVFLLRRARISEMVIIETPITPRKEMVAKLKKRFEGKDIVIKQNDGLIGGIRITFKDFILDSTIQQALRLVRQTI